MIPDPRTDRQKMLEDFLGKLAGDPVFAALEDRAYDAGHLEADDIDRLRAADPDDPALKNLKRHVLFCDLCSREFLKRAAPEAEAELEQRERRWRRWVWILGGLTLIAVSWLVVQILIRPPAKVTRGTLGLEPTTAGRGGIFPGNLADDRLFVALTGRRRAPVVLYAFVATARSITPLVPMTVVAAGDPVPPSGWKDPGGGGPRTLLLLIADREVPTLSTPGDRDELARQLGRRLDSGGGIVDLVPMLTEVLGTARGEAFAVPIKD